MKFNEEQNLIEEIIEVIHNAVQGETLGHLSIKEGNKELKELAKGSQFIDSGTACAIKGTLQT